VAGANERRIDFKAHAATKATPGDSANHGAPTFGLTSKEGLNNVQTRARWGR
jgi:hypothetical protein